MQSFNVSDTISAQRVVTCVTGTAYGVKYPAAKANICIGVTDNEQKKVGGGSVPVRVVGERAKLAFNDTVTSGCLVGADAAGLGVPFSVAADTYTAAVAAGSYVGVLLGPTIGLTGTIAEILVMPGTTRGA